MKFLKSIPISVLIASRIGSFSFETIARREPPNRLSINHANINSVPVVVESSIKTKGIISIMAQNMPVTITAISQSLNSLDMFDILAPFFNELVTVLHTTMALFICQLFVDKFENLPKDLR